MCAGPERISDDDLTGPLALVHDHPEVFAPLAQMEAVLRNNAFLQFWDL
jgi:hypothetical protein